jgi:hypothetical protein
MASENTAKKGKISEFFNEHERNIKTTKNKFFDFIDLYNQTRFKMENNTMHRINQLVPHQMI